MKAPTCLWYSSTMVKIDYIIAMMYDGTAIKTPAAGRLASGFRWLQARRRFVVGIHVIGYNPPAGPSSPRRCSYLNGKGASGQHPVGPPSRPEFSSSV